VADVLLVGARWSDGYRLWELGGLGGRRLRGLQAACVDFGAVACGRDDGNNGVLLGFVHGVEARREASRGTIILAWRAPG
jgi:hypothetical protein